MKINWKKGKIAKFTTSVILSAVMCGGLVACGGGPDTGKVDVAVPGYEGNVSVNGTVSGYTNKKGKFYSDYSSIEEAHEAGRLLNIRTAGEGFVLLKNSNRTLPLRKDERSVSLFGIKSVDIQTGGGGSGAGSPGSYGVPVSQLQDGLAAEGFKVNPKLISLYKSKISAFTTVFQHPSGDYADFTMTNELPLSFYSDGVVSSYGTYDDAAIITISRRASEGGDHFMDNVPDHKDTTDHYLELTDTEEELIKHVKANFDKVIVLINSSNIMEVGELAADKTDDNLGVDAILWIGHTGNDGAYAVGSILSGSVNPSGHTSDIWSRDFTKDPTYTNYGLGTQNGNEYDSYLYVDGEDSGLRSVEYREGIYMGYRYYETVATDLGDNGENWYQENVVYPFGYGLSYTTFNWELDDSIPKEGLIEKANGTVTMKVKVTNEGNVAGKDVVQIYASQPYYAGGIEKASSVLLGFAKTDLLDPGESQTVEIKITAQDMASFDWNDKNNNGFIGYELEHGDYVISANRNSHERVLSITRTVKEDIKCATDIDTGANITAMFSQSDDYDSTNDALVNNLASRESGVKVPAPSSKADRTVSQTFVDSMKAQLKGYWTYQDVNSDPWYVTSVPSGWTQSDGSDRTNGKTQIQLSDMVGIGYSEPVINNGVATAATDADSKKWDEFMNQLTWEEMCMLVNDGNFGRPALESIGKKPDLDLDGPSQLAGNGSGLSTSGAKLVAGEKDAAKGTLWVSAVVIASTWNVELAEDIGRMVGNESLLINATGWYGPGLNIHRSPFSGRNYEYFSEDGVHSAAFAGAMISAATEKGTVCYAKHLFLNDQETNRHGVFTYADEQTMREIYLKPFEAAVKEGKTLGFMTAFNRIGNVPCAVNYNALNILLRGEWGFDGIIVTDAWPEDLAPVNLLVRGGGDIPLGKGDSKGEQFSIEVGNWNASEKTVYVKNNEQDSSCSLASPTHYYNVRKAAQHLLYASANSNSMENNLKTVASISIEVGGNDSVSQSIISAEQIGTEDFASVKLVGGNMPLGMNISENGTINGYVGYFYGGESEEKAKEDIAYGTIAAAGTYNINVSFKADGWVDYTVPVQITLKADVFAFDGAETATVGTAYSGQFTGIKEGCRLGDTVKVEMAANRYATGQFSEVKYSVVNGALPSGLTLSTDGTLSGTPTEQGTYTFSVLYNVYAKCNMYNMFFRDASFQYIQTYTITVA